MAMVPIKSNERQSRNRSHRKPSPHKPEIPSYESRNVTQQLVSRMDDEIAHQRKINEQLEQLLQIQ